MCINLYAMSLSVCVYIGKSIYSCIVVQYMYRVYIYNISGDSSIREFIVSLCGRESPTRGLRFMPRYLCECNLIPTKWKSMADCMATHTHTHVHTRVRVHIYRFLNSLLYIYSQIYIHICISEDQVTVKSLAL